MEWTSNGPRSNLESGLVPGGRSPQKTPESDLTDSFEARRFIDEWIGFYNTERPHLALDGKTPAEAYRGNPPVDRMDKLLRALPTPPQAQRQRQEDLAKERSWRYE